MSFFDFIDFNANFFDKRIPQAHNYIFGRAGSGNFARRHPDAVNVSVSRSALIISGLMCLIFLFHEYFMPQLYFFY